MSSFTSRLGDFLDMVFPLSTRGLLLCMVTIL